MMEELYLSNPETEASEARKLAVLIKGYLQSMKSNIREIIRYIDDTTLEKSKDVCSSDLKQGWIFFKCRVINITNDFSNI